MSDTAWRKHFAKSANFLHEILNLMLLSFLPQVDIFYWGKVKNVLLVDASVVSQNGKNQERQADVILRITPKHFCLYNADGESISTDKSVYDVVDSLSVLILDNVCISVLKALFIAIKY